MFVNKCLHLQVIRIEINFKKAKDSIWDEQDIETQINLHQSGTEGILDKIAVQAALNELTEDLREIVVLYYFQELKLAEIADVLQIGLPLVKYRMKQARLRLEKLLKED